MKSIPGFNNDWDLSFALIKLLSKGISRKDFKQNISILSEKIKTSADYLATKDIFQSYYLGTKLFKKLYKRPAPIVSQTGLIKNETLLLDLDILRKITEKYKVGVATGRPKFEALFALRNLKISPQLIKESYVVGKEDAQREKPFPEPLLKAAELLDCKQPIYLGDSVNDVLAAQAAVMPCIFVGKNKQAAFEVEKSDKIKKILCP
jgi:HAD superfamily hydrolase (TIGR01549 family)